METVDIIGEIIESLTFQIEINSVDVDADDNFVLGVDKTYWLNSQSKVTINGKQYRVKAFTINESLTVKSLNEATPLAGEFVDVPAPTYKHGTLKMIKSEVNNQSRKKFNHSFSLVV